MSEQNPLVSVIIPVYNTNISLLSKSLKSVFEQTYSDCEYIIVDDGSRSEVADFLDSLQNGSRIKVIHQENAGVSVARNTGLSYVKGKYFCFFDADDYSSPDFVERLLNAAEANESDLCIAEFALISDTDNSEIAHARNKYECTVMVDDENRQALLQQTFHYVSGALSLTEEPYNCLTNDLWLQGKVWGKLYRTDVYGDLTFVKGIRVSEDALFSIDVLKKCKNVSFVKDTCYYYYVNSGSATRSDTSFKGCDILFVSMKQKLTDHMDIFYGMYSALMFGCIKGTVANKGIFKGYRLIKDFCLLPEIKKINNELSMMGVAHSQEKRTRMCLKNKWFMAITIITYLNILKEKIK